MSFEARSGLKLSRLIKSSVLRHLGVGVPWIPEASDQGFALLLGFRNKGRADLLSSFP